MIARQASREWRFEGKVVRTIVGEDGEPRFVGVDVCRMLGLSNHRMGLSRLGVDQKSVVVLPTPGGPQETIVIDESGLYTLALSSRKEEARRFVRWVTKEVLPEIRKTGRYNLVPESDDPILAGLGDLQRLRAAEVARERCSAALRQADGEYDDSIRALASPSGKGILEGVVAWCGRRAFGPPLAEISHGDDPIKQGSRALGVPVLIKSTDDRAIDSGDQIQILHPDAASKDDEPPRRTYRLDFFEDEDNEDNDYDYYDDEAPPSLTKAPAKPARAKAKSADPFVVPPAACKTTKGEEQLKALMNVKLSKAPKRSG